MSWDKLPDPWFNCIKKPESWEPKAMMPFNQSDSRPRQFLIITCYALLLLWVLWWAFSIHQGKLLFVEYFWYGKFPAFGVDFLRTIDRPSRIWVQGNDPYTSGHLFVYPPLVTRLFAWTALVSPKAALNITIWIFALSAFLGARSS